MCVYSKFWLLWERKNLAPYAVHSDSLWYSKRSPYDKSDLALDSFGSRSRYRTAFEIDKDRITNSQAFRRLEYKTQVFVTHEGDNYRTRLTHTLETVEIARHIARSLRLNEHMVEAIALGHDLGHAPYGHVAEETINSWIKNLDPPLRGNYYFCHNRQSIEIVEHLEPGYDWDSRRYQQDFGRGLNLTRGVREGILVHTDRGFRGLVHTKANFDEKFESQIRELSKANKEKNLFYPGSLEAQVVWIADELAQRIHDLEDGFRSNMLKKIDIQMILVKFLGHLQEEIFDLKNISSERHIKHKNYGTEISKLFLADIISMLSFTEKDKDTLGNRNYPAIEENEVEEINRKLADNKDYQDNFLLAAQIAFILHMWRDDDYLSKLNTEEQEKSRTRILKYLKLVKEIITLRDDHEKMVPTYHIIALLRGIMLANVIEHSFWNIHRIIDPDFRKIDEEKFTKEIEEFKKSNKPVKKYFLIFIVVDGFTCEKRNKLFFEPYKDHERRWCVEFENKEQMNEFIENDFGKVLASNGRDLKKIQIKGKHNFIFLNKVSWINKSENPEITEYVKIEYKEQNCPDIVPIENARIHFTGYKELCPGSLSSKCDYATQIKKHCSHSTECCFWSTRIKHPGINRLVEFQNSMSELDHHLEKLIAERMHRASRVARMNYMGKKVIRELLDIYLENPRLMHDRSWAWLRTYSNMDNVSPPVREWIERPINEKEIIPENVLKRLVDRRDANFKYNRYTLIRRIIEHISGMTDRFIANEYNRVHQSGRESELQDELYFFS